MIRTNMSRPIISEQQTKVWFNNANYDNDRAMMVECTHMQFRSGLQKAKN